MYYFAYGSNMQHHQMLEERCPGAKFIGLAILEGYWMVYDGYSIAWKGAVANIVPSRQDEVWGGLFEITEDHLAKLDTFEGCPKYYKRELVDVIRPGAKNKLQAWVYSRPAQAAGRPSRLYLDAVVQGAKDCRLPQDYITSVIDNFHRG